MLQTLSTFITVDEFIIQYGDNEGYELIDGELIDIEATGADEEVAGFVGRKLNVEIDRGYPDYVIPYRCLIKLLATSKTKTKTNPRLALGRIILVVC